MARDLIIDNCCTFTTAPKAMRDGNIDYERISIHHDDGSIEVIYTGNYWDEKSWLKQISAYEKQTHPILKK